jgi:hypothetical protein
MCHRALSPLRLASIVMLAPIARGQSFTGAVVGHLVDAQQAVTGTPL